MEKQSQYITDLYGQLVSIDPSYKKDVSFESFQKSVSSDPAYRKSLYNQLVSLDPTYKDDVSFESFEVSIIGSPEKKKESASALPSQDLGQSPVSGKQQGTVSAPTTKAPTQPQQPVAKGPVQQTPITGTIGLPEFVTETPAEKPLQPGQGVLAQPKQQPTKQPVQTTGQAPTPQQQAPTPQQQAPKFGEEFTRRVLEAPTEESLYSYLTTINPNRYKFKTEGPLGADPTAISTAYSERTPEQLRGFLKETVFELNKIKSSDMSNDVKALMAKDLIRKKLVKYGEPVGETKPITDDLIISEAAVRNSNPRGFNQVIDERIKSQAIDTPIVEGWSKSDPFGSYKNKMISQAFSSSYGTNLNDPMAKEAFLVTRLERLKNADPSVLNSPDHKERIKKFETEIDLLRKERIESFRTKIEEANAKLEEIESLGNYDSAALAQARKELKLAEDELDGYLNPDKAAVVVYSSNPTISLEAGETPMDKMKNHLARLVHERNEIRSQISTGENIAGFILPNNERQKRLAELESQIKTLTPVVLLNTGPRTSNVEEGSFFDAAIRSMTKTVAPGGLFSDLPISQQEGAQNILGAMVQSGIDLSVYNPDKLNDLKERTKGYGLGDSRYWGELLGGTAGYLLPGFVGGALTQPFKISKAIKGTKFLGRLTNIAADAVDSGAAYMVGGTLLPRYEDMTFVSGALGGVFGNVGKNILPLIPFLNKEGKNFLVNRIAAGIAETGEEFGNTIGETWKQYGMDGFWEGMKEQFPNADETFKFVISTFALGTVMGSGTEAGRAFMRQAQEEFENATPEQQRAMQPAIDEIFDESVAIQQAGSDDLKNQSSAKGAEQQVTPAAEEVAPVAEEVTPAVEEAAQVTAAEEVAPIAEPIAPVVEAAPVVTPEAQGELDALTQRADEITAILREDNATKQATGKGQLTRTERDKLVNEVSDINRQIQEAQRIQAPVTPAVQMAPTAPIEVKQLSAEELDFKGDLVSQLKQQTTPQEVQRDQEDIQRLPSEERIGQEPVQAEPIEGAGREAVAPGGMVQEQGQEVAPVARTEAGSKRAYDFDDTLYDPKTKKLTPLGEEVKARIAAGEDVTIVTARNSRQTGDITKALGISKGKIQATGSEAKKGEVLDKLGIDRNDYYDADQAKMDAIQGRVPAAPTTQAPVAPATQEQVVLAPKPTKESVTERTGINHPFAQKVTKALVELGLVSKDFILGGDVQSDGQGGFAAGDMYFKADGSISYVSADGIVTFDKNGDVISEDTKETAQKKKETAIQARKDSIADLEKTRDSEGFKYKTVTETDMMGNKKSVKKLKTTQELKESTDKINAVIDKAKAELKELVGADSDATQKPVVEPTAEAPAVATMQPVTAEQKAAVITGDEISFNYKSPIGGEPIQYTGKVVSEGKDATTGLRKLFVETEVEGNVERLPVFERDIVAKKTAEPAVEAKPKAEEAKPKTSPKKTANRIRQAKIDTKGKAFDATIGLPIALWNQAIEMVALAVEGGMALADAIKKGIDFINKQQAGKKWNEDEFRKKVQGSSVKQEGRPRRVVTMFSGAGTMEAALSNAESVMAVEYTPEYIEAYNNAFGLDYKPKDVTTVDPQEVIDANPDIFHASPVCKNFSAAKSKKTVEKTDMDSANAVARVITEAKPPVVTIENVPQYEGTVPFQTIIDALEKAGYTFDVAVYNAADFGGVQNRKRLLIRAVKDGELPPVPQKQKQGDWYDAVKDLIDAAPDAPFKSRTGETNWEQQRIKEMVKQGKLDPTKPIITMGGSAFKGEAAASNAGNPSPTLKSTSKEVPRIIMPDGRVKRVTPEMMKRIMGLPDSYALPEDSKIAKEVLGNGIDGAFTKALIQPLVDRQVATEEAGKVSPQSEVKAALDKMKNAWGAWLGSGMGVMDSQEEEAIKLAAAIDATLNFGAALIKMGVTDLAEWSKQVKDTVQKTGSTWMDNLSDAAVKRMFEASMERAEKGVKPTQAPAKETEEEKAPEGQKVRKAYKSAKEKGGIDIDEVLAEQDKFYPPRKIADVTEYAKQFIKEKGTQGVIEYLRSGTTDFDTAVIAGKELLKYWHNQAKTTSDPKAKAEALRNAADVASELFQLGSRLGQGVNAYKGYAEGMMLFGPEFMLKFATKRVAEVRKKILGRTEKIDQAAAESINEGTDDAKNIAINSNSVTNAIDEAINESKPETILGLTKEQIRARQAKALAKARAAFKGGELLTGADIRPLLDAVAAVAEYGFYLAAEGVVNFKTWSARIKKEIPNITDDILQKAWQTEYEGITPEMMAAKISATDKLSGIMADKKDKASDPLRQVADIVRKKIKGRTKSEPKSPTAQLAEAVTNAERYADAWNTARAEVINKIQNGPGTDSEKQSKIDALNKALDEAIGQPFSDSLVKKAIKKEMEARNQTMKDVLKDYDLAKMTADEVAKKISEDTGLAEEQAKKVADAVKKEFDNNIKKARRAALLRNLGAEGKIYFDFVDKVGEKISPDEWNKYLAEKYKLPTLDDETIQQLNDVAEQAASLPEGSYVQSKTGAEAMKILADINGIDKAGLFWDLHYAKMLGSFKTHARNIIGNFYNAVTEIGITGIEQLIRNGDFFAGFNSAMGFLNAAATMGQLMSREVAATGIVVKGSKFEAPGTIESIRKGQNIFKWAGTPGQKATQMLTYAKYVGRALAAEDAFFFQASRGMRMREIIREEVIKNNKLLGLKKSQKQIWKEVNDILYGTKAEQAAAKRTVEYEAQKFGYTKREKALRYYEIMEERIPSKVKGEGERVGAFISYNYKPVGILGGLSEMISNFKAKNSRNKLLNLIIPFTRVPANVLNQQLSFTPVGVLRAMTKSGRAEFDLITSEQRNRELIKGVLGTTMMTMAMYPLIAEFLLGERDDEDKEKFSFKVHGPGPKNYDMRVLMESQGWTPYSVELTINGKTTFIPYQQSPFALPLTIAGTLKDTFASGNFSQKEYSDIAWHVAAKAMASVSDRSFLSGLGDAFEILSGDERAGKKLERMFIRSTNPMPNFVPEIAGWVDGLLGDKDELKYKPTDFGSEYIKNLPVVRDMYGLKPDLDVFGRPIKNTSSSPFSLIAREKTPDTVVDFMVENGLSIEKPGQTTKINGELATEDQLRRIVELSGPQIYKSIQFSIPTLRMYTDKDIMQTHINAIRTSIIDDVKFQVYMESK